MSEWFSNLPAVIMTEHRLSEGIARIEEGSQSVEIEPWVTARGGTMRFYREDADVLRYLADCLENFDVSRPAEEDTEKSSNWWASMHSDADEPHEHPGPVHSREACPLCQEMIRTFGPMPPKEEILERKNYIGRGMTSDDPYVPPDDMTDAAEERPAKMPTVHKNGNGKGHQPGLALAGD